MTNDSPLPRRTSHDWVLVERLDNACPLFRYRVSYGGTHAVGPTEEDAMETLNRVCFGKSDNLQRDEAIRLGELHAAAEADPDLYADRDWWS